MAKMNIINGIGFGYRQRRYFYPIGAFLVLVVILWRTMGTLSEANELVQQALQAKIFRYQDQIEQLLLADRQRSRTLMAMRQQIRLLMNTSAGLNRSDGSGIPSILAFDQFDLTVPNFYEFLPHLLLKPPTKLNPPVKLQPEFPRKNVFLVIGIPTTKREGLSYLVTSLQSLFTGLNPTDRLNLVFVVMAADTGGADSEFVKNTTISMKAEFRPELDAGLLEFIAVSPDWYPPDLNTIPATFGDSPERMFWRTKQNLDYIYMMLFCASRGQYYMQLEDDVVTKAGYVEKIREAIANNKERNWAMLEFSSLGFIGKLFRTGDLTILAQYIAMFYREKPVDWLLDSFFVVRYCSPEKTGKHCKQLTDNHRIRIKPSLFQHIGTRSSLPGKVQKLKERDFGKPLLHVGHVDNPPATIGTTLTVYQTYGIDAAYRGQGFYWALTPKVNDTIQFTFKEPILLKGVLFRSGSVEHPGDLIPNSTVQRKANNEAQWEPLVDFGPDGIARIDFVQPLTTNALRILIRENSSNWLILSEIWIKTN